MRHRNHLLQRTFLIGLFAVVIAAVGILLAGSPSASSAKHVLGGPRLVAVHPLPEMSMDGPMCDLQPASASAALLAALMQTPTAAAASPDVGPRNLIRDRPLLRVI